jgi:magnesium chelatase subunit D
MTSKLLSDATWVAGVLALCGPSLGGALVAEDAATEFVAAYAKAADREGALRVVPSSLAADALTGSMDLAATLAFGKPVLTPGLLTLQARLLVRRAERLDVSCASLLAQALDRDGLLLIAVMDPHDPDAALAPKLEVRLPFCVETDAAAFWTVEQILSAKDLLPKITIDRKWIQELCEAAISVGIASPRTVLQAVTTARALAALNQLQSVDEGCVALAARLVLAHRALHMPPQEQPQEPEDEPQPAEPPQGESDENNSPPSAADAEVILEAIKSALPENFLQMAGQGFGKRGAGRNVKGSAPRKLTGQRGRRVGNKRASSLAGQRLDIIATLRNAAPWQSLRRKFSNENRMVVTRDDFRVSRIKQRNEATAIFAVDASGSTAFQRLAEAKGAVETILAECYVRRDRVALVAFRGKKAEVLLPPTRSLERAKRALAGLPGGGGTPLASGLDEAFALALQVRRGGGNPIVILLTDGRGNITREGEGNKIKALEESEAAARLFAAEGFDAMLIDVSPEPVKSARMLAATMNATYLPMPRASASDIARPIKNALKLASS